MRDVAIRLLAGFLLVGASMRSGVCRAEPAAENPAPWREAMDAFEQEDRDNPRPPGAALFVGSSSIRMWDLANSFPDVATINRGFGGSQIHDSTQYADLLIVKHQPRVVVFYAGDNDIAAGGRAADVHADFRELVAKVRASLPTTPIVFVSIKPSIDRWKLRDVMQEANRLIKAECDADRSLEFVDVWPAMLGADGEPRRDIFLEDGLHMNAAGYALWTDLVRPYVAVRTTCECQ